MDELEKRMKKLELNVSIWKFAFLIICFVCAYLIFKNYSLNNKFDNYSLYYQDKIDGTYDKVINSNDSSAGVGYDDDSAEISAYLKDRKLYFENK